MNDAWHPWIPTLIELEHQKSLEPDDSAVDWSKFGWEALEVPVDAPHVAARMDKLGELFLERFANRMLNSETLERWQVRLQHTMDRIAPVYERAYALYEKHAQALQDGALPGRTTTTESDLRAGGSDVRAESGTDETSRTGADTVGGKTKTSDTPDSAISESDDYAGTIEVREDKTSYGSKVAFTRGGKTTTEYGRTDKGTVKVTETVDGEEMVRSLNANIDGWRNLDSALVAEFENNFLNLWWYRWEGSHWWSSTPTRTSSRRSAS